MFISLQSSGINGFKKWSDGQKPCSNDDGRLGAIVITAEPAVADDATMPSSDQRHRPRLVPGAGPSL